MRLTKIKLAGFKSFVDPTVFYLPSNLVGIVGPNGCGKSNLIDAVRWVMGESSARTLRGESMADVIFGGSSTRKPVGQASVELIFDNAQDKLGGPWANYNEIAVKRLVSRDGQSVYFLNNARCRRRDITDILLGTGLGPRSYAIIEQGMIARIVEARPEDLRLFLEEAAGISKYKERRRETETRIRHTRENLARLTDVREELARQLKHLQRQAQSAERYKQYRAEERRCKAALLASRWQRLDTDIKDRESRVREQETALEARVAEQRSLETRLETGRERQAALNERLNGVQERYYAVGAEISRLELSLEHQRDLRRRQGDDLRQAEQTLSNVLAQIGQDADRLDELKGALHEAAPALALAQAQEAEAGEGLAQAEAAMGDWQAQWESFGQRTGANQRVAEVEKTRIEQLERQLLQAERRLDRFRLEQDSLDTNRLTERLEELVQQEQEAAADLAREEQVLQALAESAAELRRTQGDLAAQLHDARECVQTGRGRLTSLETLQQAALGRHAGAVAAWLQARGLDQAPRLAERLQVETGWERATETVLGAHLEAVCVEGLEAAAAMLGELTQGNLALFDTSAARAEESVSGNGLLAGKVRSPWPLAGLLTAVSTASDLDDALARREHLAARESLITPDGTWLGRNWLRVTKSSDDKFGMLARERDIQGLQATLARDEERLASLASVLEQSRDELQGLEARRDALQQSVNRRHRDHARLQEQTRGLRGQLERSLARTQAISEELMELSQHRVDDQESLGEARMRMEEALLSLEQMAQERDALHSRRQALYRELDERRAAATDVRSGVQQRALAMESLGSEVVSTEQALVRLEAQRAELETRRERLLGGLAAADDETDQEGLEALLAERLQVEQDLTQARATLEAEDKTLRDMERARTARERQVQELRERLESQRVALGESAVRAQTLLDQLGELELNLADVLATLPGEDEAQLQEQLEKLTRQIQRLGPVNLAAIEEFTQLGERKDYLDAQNQDLETALSTLEEAIRRIDRETRSRFKETFERVNDGLQGLFPQLFGGGQAHLELTGEDVLDAGVAIMAQPPGKRIGHIQLLSGGEKALTAVAFVFAIFQLNPAPFCMLDEVDAPLDEANVGRFGKLVRDMSEQVQFIFITHNKGTMEIALHLSGVTMHEPGVSRLVSVDMAEAMRLAAE